VQTVAEVELKEVPVYASCSLSERWEEVKAREEWMVEVALFSSFSPEVDHRSAVSEHWMIEKLIHRAAVFSHTLGKKASWGVEVLFFSFSTEVDRENELSECHRTAMLVLERK
jgi:hypothetical protein